MCFSLWDMDAVLFCSLAFLLFTDNTLAVTWQSDNGMEYYFGLQGTNASQNWHSARAWCMQNGGDLTSITSEHERNYISGKVTNNGVGYRGRVWLGLNSLSDRDTWIWSNSDNVGVTYWEGGYPTQPSYSGPYLLCAIIHVTDHPGEWRNIHCDVPMGFVCKRDIGSSGPITDSPTPSVGGYCPDGFYNYNPDSNKCYLVVELDEEIGVTWLDARDICREKGGYQPDLVSIHSYYENAVLTSQLQKYVFGMHIGLIRSASSWLWNDNSALDYDNWGPGEPNDGQNHCAEIWMVPGPVGTWNNIACNTKRGYICQTYKDNIINTPPSTTTNTCPAGFMPYWYACYKALPTPMTWDDARTECQTTPGADLVSIHSYAENAAVFTKVDRDGGLYWIGMNDSMQTGEYSWSDGWAVLHTEWGVNEPAENDGGGCVAMETDGLWYDRVCTELKKGICKYTTADPITPPTPPEGMCPGESEGLDLGWKKHGQNCYLFGGAYEFLRWSEASGKCKELGGDVAHLTSIHDIQENRYILDNLEDSYYGYWIGMYRRQSDGAFHWVDGSPAQYINWAQSEPNGQDNGQDCVEFYGSNNMAGFWNDHICSEWKSYICKAYQVPPPPTVSEMPGWCPDGWEAYGAHCYYLHPNDFSSWLVAEGHCKELSNNTGDLASIHSLYEHQWVHNRMVELTELPQPPLHNYWIGLSKSGPVEDGFEYHWTDGTAVDVEFWETGEPNDLEGVENCVQVWSDSGTWNDYFCDTHYGYVCKMLKITDEGNTEAAGGLSSGEIAGIVIGVLLALTISVALGVFIADRQGCVAVRGRASDAKKNVISGITNPNYDNMQSPPEIPTDIITTST